MERREKSRPSIAEVDKSENKPAMPIGSSRQGVIPKGVTPRLYKEMMEYYDYVQKARKDGFY